MTGRSHLVIGTTTAVAGTVAAGCTIATASAVVVAAAATAKLPDVDQNMGIRHRGATHTAIACVLVAAVVGFVLSLDAHSAPYATAALIGVLIGYGMHLVADACTPHGVPAFAPFVRRDVHLLPPPLRIVTGSWREGLIVAVLAVGAVVLVYHVYS